MQIKPNSALLSKMPDAGEYARSRTQYVVIRSIITAAVFVLFAYLARSVMFRTWPSNTLGAILYYVHDYIYLWVKGNTLVRFLPVSIGWWGAITTIALLVLASFVMARSFILTHHIALARYAVKQLWLHRFLVSGVKICHRLGGQLVFLRTLVENEQELAIIDINKQPLNNASRDLCQLVCETTSLWIQLERMCCRNSDQWHALDIWHRAYLMLRAYGKPDKDWFHDLKNRFGDMYQWIENPRHESKAVEETHGFQLQQLDKDTHILLSLDRERINLQNAEPNLHDVNRTSHLQLICSIGNRRELLDKAYMLFQNSLTLQIPPIVQNQLPALDNSPFRNLVAGHIALDIALNLALLTNEFHIGLAYLESVESLAYILGASLHLPPLADHYAYLVNAHVLPQTTASSLVHKAVIYRLCSLLMQKVLDEEQTHWNVELSSTDGLVRQEDYDFEQFCAQGLMIASADNAIDMDMQ